MSSQAPCDVPTSNLKYFFPIHSQSGRKKKICHSGAQFSLPVFCLCCSFTSFLLFFFPPLFSVWRGVVHFFFLFFFFLFSVARTHTVTDSVFSFIFYSASLSSV